MARVRRELRASSAGRDGADAMRIEATDVVDAVEELTMAAASPRAQGGKKADVTSAARSPATMVSSGLWTTLWGRRLSLRLVSSPRASTSLSTSSSSTHSTYSTSSSSTSIPTQPGMRDSDPHRMSLVSLVLDTAISCFRRHGAQAMDTPLLERK
ncbi:unnamed protein product, partial [Lampetra planeri]